MSPIVPERPLGVGLGRLAFPRRRSTAAPRQAQRRCRAKRAHGEAASAAATCFRSQAGVPSPGLLHHPQRSNSAAALLASSDASAATAASKRGQGIGLAPTRAGFAASGQRRCVSCLPLSRGRTPRGPRRPLARAHYPAPSRWINPACSGDCREALPTELRLRPAGLPRRRVIARPGERARQSAGTSIDVVVMSRAAP